MEESIRNRLTQESVHQTGSNGGHVMPSRDQSLTVGNLDAVNPFERQHAPGGTVPVNGGNDIARLRHHRCGQLRSGCGLSAQIKLTRGPALHIRNHLAWAQAGCFPSQQFQMCGCPFVSVDIAVELPVDTRPKHLYRNMPAIRRNRMMNLRNGGSADGSFVKRGKQDFERLAKALRSEEHTSELQSLMRISYAVFCLKKKHKCTTYINHDTN